MAPFLVMAELKQALFLLIWLNENVENVVSKKLDGHRTPTAGQTHQNYSDKNCNISNCKTLIINVLDLLILDIFRIFIV